MTVINLNEKNEPGHSISCKTACAPSEDWDQPAHPRSLIRVFTWHSVGSKDLKRLQAKSEDSDQPSLMRRLIFAGRTCNLVVKSVPRLKCIGRRKISLTGMLQVSNFVRSSLLVIKSATQRAITQSCYITVWSVFAVLLRNPRSVLNYPDMVFSV